MVTVDAMGRVTAGRQMQPADVPGLDWSKITSGTPTTLAGYGISDATPLDAAGRATAQTFRAAKGFPATDNAAVGFAFGPDGDTGLFADYTGSNPVTGTRTLCLKIDTKDVFIADRTGGAWITGYGWLHEKFAGIDAAPPGKVSHFAMTAPPAGWVKCDGALLSRAAYPALFAAIGTTFGAGDGKTTFGVPDLRGEFVRGWDDGRGVDTGRAAGSWQRGSQFIFDDGDNVGVPTMGKVAAANYTAGSQSPSETWDGYDGGGLAFMANASVFKYNSDMGAAAAKHARPRNVALLACIKI
ncbi:hypothetical protein CEK28_14055 [Xenophilus sp. AP218F]|nr:hypothetical protein CEK28_14055 [Xenophilus sp. AP218F]